MRIALNGFGRIGRSFLRALIERERQGGRTLPVTLVAINDVGQPHDLAYLMQYDSTHGTLPEQVTLEQGALCVGRHQPQLLQQTEPDTLPWAALEVDLVLECTGELRARDAAAGHLRAGGKRVLMGAVPFDRADALMVYGVNHALLPEQAVVSAASCTTHCVAPLLKLLDQHWGVEHVLMQEVHAYTSDQSLLDHVHRDPRRGRAAAQNIVPTTSSAIGALQQVFPHLKGRIDGGSIRVPTLNVAMASLTLRLRQAPSEEQVNTVFEQAARQQPGYLAYNQQPLVSLDFNHRPESAIFDATQTLVQGDMLRLVAWYDNEWGYANRLLDLVAFHADTQAKHSG